MANLFNKSLFAFMARLAIICNLTFLLSVMKMLFSWFAIPDFMANFIAILGLVVAPILNIGFALACIVTILLKNKIEIPIWQTIVIVFMLILQILFALF